MELFKMDEVRCQQFIQLPKELFLNEKYKKLTMEAKVLYGFLLDKMELSRVNNWCNEEGEIYLIFAREKIQELLCISKPTCVKAFQQLVEIELIKEKRQGLGKPNLIYIAHMELEPIENSQKSNNFTSESKENLPQRLKKFTSGNKENLLLEVKNFCPNNTNINNTNLKKTYISDTNTTTTREEQEAVVVEDIKVVKSIFTDHDITDAQAEVILEVSKHDVNQIEKVYKHFKDKPCDNFIGLMISMVRPDVFCDPVSNVTHDHSNYNKYNRQVNNFSNYGNHVEYDYEYIERKLLGWDKD